MARVLGLAYCFEWKEAGGAGAGTKFDSGGAESLKSCGHRRLVSLYDVTDREAGFFSVLIGGALQ